MDIKIKNKNNKTFRQNGIRLYRCPCGFDKMRWVPNGTRSGSRMYSAMCAGCGDIIHSMSCSHTSVADFKDAWNKHMRTRQEQENGQIDEK
jgi:hypothetical protein